MECADASIRSRVGKGTHAVRNAHPAGPNRTTRRSFVKLAAAGPLLAGSVPLRAAWAQSSATRASPLGNLPSFDGELVFDDVSRQAAAVDNGGYVRRMPMAVLNPRSVDDIARILSYANKHGLKVAMRGRAHSHSGQALVACTHD